MAKKFRCPRPINRLVMHRAKGLSGPFYQGIGSGRCIKSQGNFFGPGGGGSSQLLFHGIYPDGGGEMQGVLAGVGGLSVARVADIWLPDYLGVYRRFLGGEIGYRGGRADLDPAKLIATVKVVAGTDASPTIIVVLGDGSTHREKYSGDGDYILGDSIASGDSASYRPPDGWEIGIYAGNVAAVTVFTYNANQFEGSIPNLSALSALATFYCNTNSLTGSIPDLSANTLLTHFRCNNNSLSGSIPNLSALSALATFYCDINGLTGSIPDLSANTLLTHFRCQFNSLTGFDGGWPNKAFSFNASGNALTEAAVNKILIDADTYGIAVGTTIDLTGGTNAAPTGAGVTAKNSLITNGATVSTN